VELKGIHEDLKSHVVMERPQENPHVGMWIRDHMWACGAEKTCGYVMQRPIEDHVDKRRHVHM
jgi:hypothetical protein